jgi:hypothetical protein
MASFTGGPKLREALKDFGLNTAQTNAAMAHLQGGGDFKSLKDLLKGYGFKGSQLGTLKDPVTTYLSTGSSGTTPTPTPAPVAPPTPLLPGITPPNIPAFDDVNPYTGLGVPPFTPTPPPTPTPTPTPTNLEDLFPGPPLPPEPVSTFVGPLLPGISESGFDIPDGYVDDLPPAVDGVDGTGGMSIEDLIALITAGLPDAPEMPEMPDFDTMLQDQADAYADALAEAEAGYATMLEELEAEQAAAEEEARIRRLTEMSNMAQGGQIADFKALAAQKNRGGTSQFKGRGTYGNPGGIKKIKPMVNKSLSLGGTTQMPGIGGVKNSYGMLPGILSKKAGSLA